MGSLVSAAQARLNYRKLRYEQGTLTMLAPSFAGDSLLPDLPGDHPNMLKKPHGVERDVEVPYFDVNGTGTVRVQLMVGEDLVGTAQSFPLPLDPADFPKKFTLPAAYTENNGPVKLRYRATHLGNPNTSDALDFYVDTVPPNQGQPGRQLELPPEVEAGGVTREYLDANGSVDLTIPDYIDAKLGDVITAYADSIEIGSFTRDDLSVPMVIEWKEDKMPHEGSYPLVYTLADRSENIGPRSTFKNVNVYLTAAPANLVPPKVPQFDDGLIDLDDAQEGVGVQIDEYDNYAAGDAAQVYWAGVAVGFPVPISGFPAFATIPYITVRETPADTGPKQRKVTYSIVRGVRSFPEPTGIELDIDLRVGGPDNPDPEPDPEVGNPALAVVTVQGAVSAVPNVIAPEDAGEDATASVELYAGAVLGEVLHLLWNGVEVDKYEVTGSEPAGFIVPFNIAWADIEAGGNSAALPVRYVVSNADNENLNRSPFTDVAVSAVVVTLPAVTYLNLYDDPDEGPIVNCSTLRDDPQGTGKVIEIRVAGGEDRLADQALTFNFQGYSDAEGTTPIADTAHEFTYTPNAQEAASGFTVRVPYDPYVLNIRLGYGGIQYSAVINGLPVPSAEEIRLVYVELPGGGGATCPVKFRR